MKIKKNKQKIVPFAILLAIIFCINCFHTTSETMDTNDFYRDAFNVPGYTAQLENGVVQMVSTYKKIHIVGLFVYENLIGTAVNIHRTVYGKSLHPE